MSLQKLGYDALKSYAGVFVASNLKANEKLNFGNNIVAEAGSNGVIYATISDAINYFSGARSDLANGDLRRYLDSCIFFGALSGGAILTNADVLAFNTVKGVSPLSPELNAQLVETAIITGGRFLGDYIESTPQAPQMLRNLRRPTRLIS